MTFKFTVNDSLRSSIVGTEACELLDQIEEINALSSEIADLQSYGNELEMVHDNLAAALAHVESFGVTKTFLATFDSEYELTRALEVQEIALSSLESMSESALEKLDAKYEAALEGKMADVWGKIKEFFRNIWNRITELATKFWNWLKGLFSKNKEKAKEAEKTAAEIAKDPEATKKVETVLAIKSEEKKEVAGSTVSGVDVGLTYKDADGLIEFIAEDDVAGNLKHMIDKCIDKGISSSNVSLLSDPNKYEQLWQNILETGYAVKEAITKRISAEVESNIAKDPPACSIKLKFPNTSGKSPKELGWGNLHSCHAFLKKYSAKADAIVGRCSKAEAMYKVANTTIQKALANLDKVIADAKKEEAADMYSEAKVDHSFGAAAKYRDILNFASAYSREYMTMYRSCGARVSSTVGAVARIVAQAKLGK